MTVISGSWKPVAAALFILGLGIVVYLGVKQGLFTLRSRIKDPRDPGSLSKTLVPAAVAVAPGVYLLGETAPAAAYLVETSEGLILIDTGLDDDAASIRDQLAKLHFEQGELRAILLTHAHADHSQGAQHLRTRTGAKVHAGKGDCPPLRQGKPREAFTSSFDMPNVVPHRTTVDVELVGGETLTFGDARIEAIATPGHTPGSMCYLLERPGVRALFTGDVVLHLGPSGGDSLGTYTAYLPPLYRGNVSDFLATLKKLKDLPRPEFVFPGHPNMDLAPESPALSPERWREIIDAGIAEMEQLLKRYETDGANFLDDIPKELLPGLHYLGAFGGSAVYCLNTPKGLFLFDAPGGPELVDFLNKRFAKLGWDGRKLTAVLLTSAGPTATAGLKDLVRAHGCQVVVGRAARQEVQRLCPEGTKVIPAEDEENGWFEVKTLILEGRGVAPAAYVLRWAGKSVLVSGNIPVKLTTPSAQRLWNDLSGPGGNAAGYAKSLELLEQQSPDLWLPAVPVHGQNANLYDRDWAKVIGQNKQLVQTVTGEQ